MGSNPFQPAVRAGRKARMAIIGPSGSGKTFTALGVASAFGKTAVIDTENGTAALYSDEFTFDVMEMTPPYDPRRVPKGIELAADAGYDVLVIDSLSPFWAGSGGTLELVDEAKARSRSHDGFSAWRQAGPIQQEMVDALIHSPIHLIVTLRAKQAYEVTRDAKGKMQVEKLGLEPVQRDMLEYEFDLVCEMDMQHRLVVSKSRMVSLADSVHVKPGVELGGTVRDWLQGSEGSDGSSIAEVPDSDSSDTKPGEEPFE